MLITSLLALIISFNTMSLPTDSTRNEIKQKRHEIVVLSTEVQIAKRTVGLAETIDYVEKIGLIRQLQEQIIELEEQQ